MLEKIKAILSKNLKINPSEITEKTNLRKDLDVDSLALVEIVMEIENTFGIGEISDDDIPKLKTVGDIVNYIEEQKKKNL